MGAAADALFAIEGTGQTQLGANYGDGFNTNSSATGARADPNPFFKTLLTKPYKGEPPCTVAKPLLTVPAHQAVHG